MLNHTILLKSLAEASEISQANIDIHTHKFAIVKELEFGFHFTTPRFIQNVEVLH